jgi:phosphomevalonate kinase
MATLNSLKKALTNDLVATPPQATQARLLSEGEYNAGFDLLMRGSRRQIYEGFIIPELLNLLAPLVKARNCVSILEIGPGPRSALAHLPAHVKLKIKKYTAYEPNIEAAASLIRRFDSKSENDPDFPCLEEAPIIHQNPFLAYDKDERDFERYDIVLFCHSMYGMKPKRTYVERALGMLGTHPGCIVAVFHREGSMHLDGLVCHRMASFPDGAIRVKDDDDALDTFASFIAGYQVYNEGLNTRRRICRDLGSHREDESSHLFFSAPQGMATFTRHATTLPKLTAKVPIAGGLMRIKNREAQDRGPAAIVRPTSINHVQECVRWALEYGHSLTVLGGGHGGQCLWPNVVALDMGAFSELKIIPTTENDKHNPISPPHGLVVVGTGCKGGDVIRECMIAGLTVPLGSRPSVGSGLWLQGGIGHMSRKHGLTSDNIVGAVVVSVDSGDILLVGEIPHSHQPIDAIRRDNGTELLWAIKGAVTNFSIIVSVVFKAHATIMVSTRNWIVPLGDRENARHKLQEFGQLASTQIDNECSADAYLYFEDDESRLGITTFQPSMPGGVLPKIPHEQLNAVWGNSTASKSMSGVGLFDAELYVSGMHGGHAGGKTSSFKRCMFLRNLTEGDLLDHLLQAINTLPFPFCYLHLLHGGGAIQDIAPGATAFGCRDWDFACVITGVWPRELDGTKIEVLVTQWVYAVAADLLPYSNGVYGADLGPDPRDVALTEQAFGANVMRLARLKKMMDPRDVLPYACPLPKALMMPKLVVLVTGDSFAGKDHCAEIWASGINNCEKKTLTACVTSISNVTKAEYTANTGADFKRLLSDSQYKEEHRPALTAFFETQVKERPRLPEEHFLRVVSEGATFDVLLITGMRDKEPVAAFSHLVPDCRLIEIHVQSRRETQRERGASNSGQLASGTDSIGYVPSSKRLEHCPCLIFDNDETGNDAAKAYGEQELHKFFHDDLKRLISMVRVIPDFPRTGLEFRHILGVSQRPDGLSLCTSLLRTHFAGDWAKIDAIVSCEAGGFVYATALALSIKKSLVVGRLTSETKEKLKTGYIQRLFMVYCLSQDATEVYMILHK